MIQKHFVFNIYTISGIFYNQDCHRSCRAAQNAKSIPLCAAPIRKKVFLCGKRKNEAEAIHSSPVSSFSRKLSKDSPRFNLREVDQDHELCLLR